MSARRASAALFAAATAASTAIAQDAPVESPAPETSEGTVDLGLGSEPIDPAVTAAQRQAGLLGFVGWTILAVALGLYFRFRWYRRR
jgi:hypothetical protein